MSNTTAAITEKQSLEQVLRSAPELQDPATLDGMSELITKVAPLLQGRRFHNVVDLLAAVSDVIEMTDDAMVQKLMAVYEESIGSFWAIGNALRYASAQAARDESPPTVWKSLRRLRNDEDARRGLSMTVNLMAELGRQSRASNAPMPED